MSGMYEYVGTARTFWGSLVDSERMREAGWRVEGGWSSAARGADAEAKASGGVQRSLLGSQSVQVSTYLGPQSCLCMVHPRSVVGEYAVMNFRSNRCAQQRAQRWAWTPGVKCTAQEEAGTCI